MAKNGTPAGEAGAAGAGRHTITGSTGRALAQDADDEARRLALGRQLCDMVVDLLNADNRLRCLAARRARRLRGHVPAGIVTFPQFYALIVLLKQLPRELPDAETISAVRDLHQRMVVRTGKGRRRRGVGAR